MHERLKHQVLTHFGDPNLLPAGVQPLLEAVSRDYDEADAIAAPGSVETGGVEDRLQQAVSLLSAALESTADGILVVDRAGRISQMNGRFLDLWRIPGQIVESRDDKLALGFVLEQLADPEAFMRKVLDLYEHPESESFDELAFKDGRIFERYSRPQRIAGQIVGRVWSFRDVTERRHLEEQLRQSQRMEAVGTLAGGIAHDFNNLLTVMRGQLELLQHALGDSHPARREIHVVVRAADRASALTRQLLAYSRKQVLKPVPLDLGEVVHSLMSMLRRLIGENIEVAVQTEPEPCVVVVDPGQIEQVIANLVVNARDAMPEGGKVLLSIRNVTLDASRDYERLHGLPDGDFVLLCVADTGHGIAPDLRDRIFEPFFTTKETGKGTGLGLSTVYGVVKQTGGHIVLESAMGRGSEFRIYLPRTAAPATRAGAVTESPARGGGAETILLAEDESSVRQLVRSMLEREGYVVLVAERDADTLRLAADHAGTIDLLLTDVVMPGLGGIKLAEEVKRLRPGTRVLFMSGYAAEECDPNGLLARRGALLEKPFTWSALTHAVRAALEQPDEDLAEDSVRA